jgi:hypothetical protein
MAKQKTFGWSRSSVAVAARTFGGKSYLYAALAVCSTALLMGCEKGGVGDPCIPEDEYQDGFSGYSEKEVNVESRSFQCETRVCLVNNFRGRVSCTNGNGAGDKCMAPDGASEISVPVKPQLADRPPSKAVYCSCRCDGAQKEAPYCECPSGFQCKKLIDDIGLGNSQLAGSYCVKTEADPFDPQTDIAECGDPASGNPLVKDCGAQFNPYR